MKKAALYALGLLVLLFPSQAGKELGQLRPVELLYLYRENGTIIMETDTGDRGRGPTVEAAREDLKAQAPGTVFLDTADHLILTADTRELAIPMMNWLRPAAEVCITPSDPEPREAAAYLRAHPGRITLLDLRAGEDRLPTLILEEGSYHLEP